MKYSMSDMLVDTLAITQGVTDFKVKIDIKQETFQLFQRSFH